MIPDFSVLMTALVDGNVDFVVIGGVALVVHGSARVTRDLDICYSRERENMARLARALKPFRPTLRGAPAHLPFGLNEPTLRSGLNFTLSTDAGDLDLLGEVGGLGMFPVAARLSTVIELYGVNVRVLSLDGLERAKRAAGRLKDLVDLEDILAIRRQTGE